MAAADLVHDDFGAAQVVLGVACTEQRALAMGIELFERIIADRL